MTSFDGSSEQKSQSGSGIPPSPPMRCSPLFPIVRTDSKAMSSATRAVAPSSAMFPSVTAQTVASDVGSENAFLDETHCGQRRFCVAVSPFGPSSGKRGEGEVACSGNQPRNLLFDQSQESGVASPRFELAQQYSERSQISHKRQLLADYQSATRPVTLPADRKTGLPK